MKSLTGALVAGAVAACIGAAALADPSPLPTASETSQTDGFVGLTIPFGPQGIQPPHLTVGMRRASVDGAGSVQGGELSLSIDPFDLGNARLRVQVLSGNSAVQGALGVGIVVGSGAVFATGGVLGDGVRVGGDMPFANPTPDLFLQLDTLPRLAPAETAALPICAAILCVD